MCRGSRCWVRAQGYGRSEGQHGVLCERARSEGCSNSRNSGLEGWHVGEAEPGRTNARRGEALLFGIANATRGPMREAESSPRPGTRDPANEEPLGTNALKPQVPSNADPTSELCHRPGGALYRRTCIEQLAWFRDSPISADASFPSAQPTVCLTSRTLNRHASCIEAKLPPVMRRASRTRLTSNQPWRLLAAPRRDRHWRTEERLLASSRIVVVTCTVRVRSMTAGPCRIYWQFNPDVHLSI